MPIKILESGVGYSLIYKSDKVKYELSNKKTILRKTVCKNGKTIESLYERIIDISVKHKIELKSINWKIIDEHPKKEYYILVQCNAENKPTGNIKIVKKSKAKWNFFKKNVEANDDDWMYYVRRNV